MDVLLNDRITTSSSKDAGTAANADDANSANDDDVVNSKIQDLETRHKEKGFDPYYWD